MIVLRLSQVTIKSAAIFSFVCSATGRGFPDLGKGKAFIAHGGQAVTYGAGTWHAPMVVLGNKAVDFVVVQFANGVGVEDCQEVEFGKGGEGNGKGKIGVLVKTGERMGAKL